MSISKEGESYDDTYWYDDNRSKIHPFERARKNEYRRSCTIFKILYKHIRFRIDTSRFTSVKCRETLIFLLHSLIQGVAEYYWQVRERLQVCKAATLTDYDCSARCGLFPNPPTRRHTFTYESQGQEPKIPELILEAIILTFRNKYWNFQSIPCANKIKNRIK